MVHRYIIKPLTGQPVRIYINWRGKLSFQSHKTSPVAKDATAPPYATPTAAAARPAQLSFSSTEPAHAPFFFFSESM